MQAAEISNEVIYIATLVTVFGALLTAIYTSPENQPYGAWDILIGVAIIAFCVEYKTQLSQEPLFLTLSRVALSIAAMLVTMTAIQALAPNIITYINKQFFRIVDGQFLIASAIFVVSYWFY